MAIPGAVSRRTLYAVARGSDPSQTRVGLPRIFKCPSCTAPLDVATTAVESVRCAYCSSTVFLRDLTGSDVDWDVEAGEPPSADELRLLGQIARIARSGNRLQAIKVYRLGFGADLREAKLAVECLERGDPVVFTGQVHVIDATRLQEALADAARTLSESLPSARSAGLFFFALAAALALLLGGAAIAVVVVLKGSARVPSGGDGPGESGKRVDVPAGGLSSTNPDVAEVVLAFGAEGGGAGQFRDARSVAVDREGRIYAAEYTGGRVQVFDATGAFTGQWMMDPRTALHRVASSGSDVWVLQAGKVTRHEPGTGRGTGTLPGRFGDWAGDVGFGLDGSITLATRSDTIVRLAPDGSRTLEIRGAVSEHTGRTELSVKLAVDGSGEIFVLAGFEKSVFRFSADGRFVNRFGSGGDGPGQFRSPHDIAVDGLGRVYVSDTNGIHVFSADGRFLYDFGAGSEVVFGLAFDGRGDLYAACRTRIVKFRLEPHG